jgi:hypothetical protein
MLAKTKTHFSEIVDLTFSNTIAKEKCENPMVKSDMEGRISILVQLEPIVAHVAIVPSFDVATINPRIYVRVEEIEAVDTKE